MFYLIIQFFIIAGISIPPCLYIYNKTNTVSIKPSNKLTKYIVSGDFRSDMIEIPSGNNGHNYLAPKQLQFQNSKIQLITGSLNQRQIQPFTFYGEKNSFFLVSPNNIKINGQTGNEIVYLTLFDSQGKMIESEIGSPYATLLGIYLPETGNYRLEIGTNVDFEYTYKIKLE